ncbi:MAG: hypothetical protein PHV17_05505 [Candidatus Omnitrophica bacterium]|nr:hypothetical protein [Candidatus Omnitrophota bacterium]
MSELSKYKNFIIVIVLLIISYFGGKAIVENYQDKMQKVVAGEEKLLEGKKILKVWSLSDKERSQLETALFRGNERDFKLLLGQVARDFNIGVTSLKPNTFSDEYYQTVKISLDFDAEYLSLVKIIKSLEQKKINVSKLQISTSRKSSNREERLVQVEFKGVFPKEKD